MADDLTNRGPTQALSATGLPAAAAPEKMPFIERVPSALAPARQVRPNDDVEAIMRVEITNMFDLASANDADAKRDKREFWMLKIPTIVGAGAASALEAFGIGAAVIVVATIAAICAGIDAANPRGQMHNAHRKAANKAALARRQPSSGLASSSNSTCRRSGRFAWKRARAARRRLGREGADHA